MDTQNLILTLTFLLAVIAIFWRTTDPRPGKEVFKDYFSSKTLFILLCTWAFVGLSILSGLYFPLNFYGLDQLVVILGVISFASGFILCIWAKITMKHNWGVPAKLDKKRQKELITKGPFKFTRNPIYLGMSLLYIGYALSLRSTFSFLAIVPLYYFWTSAIKEEEILEKEFGEKYLQYKSKVPFLL